MTRCVACRSYLRDGDETVAVPARSFAGRTRPLHLLGDRRRHLYQRGGEGGGVSKVYRLSDVVNALNQDGYSYRRSIRAGIKRGEVYPAPLGKRSEKFVLVRARPTHIRGLWNRVTGKPAADVPLNVDYSLCFAVDDEAYEYALQVDSERRIA